MIWRMELAYFLFELSNHSYAHVNQGSIGCDYLPRLAVIQLVFFVKNQSCTRPPLIWSWVGVTITPTCQCSVTANFALPKVLFRCCVGSFQMSPRLRCGDTCQIWTWNHTSNQCLVALNHRENIEWRNFVNDPHPWTKLLWYSANTWIFRMARYYLRTPQGLTSELLWVCLVIMWCCPRFSTRLLSTFQWNHP